MSEDLLDVSSHFRFGENWSDYAKLVDDKRIAAAEESIQRLVGDVSGKSFLDIGSGSGLFSLAALRLGAREVLAVDIDPDSVATTRALLSNHARGKWRAESISVFDLPQQVKERFDVVYSWGVLHHTGDVWRAIGCASGMVKDGGTFAIALYERTPLCGAWTVEKRLYRKLPNLLQKMLRCAFVMLWGTAMLVRGRNPAAQLRASRERGMDVLHDIHDWMGGYPYQSTTGAEVLPFLDERGFELIAQVPWPVRAWGILGTGCSEYLFRRAA